MKNKERFKFHAAVFISLIVEDPFVTGKESAHIFSRADPEWLRGYAERGKALYKQYVKFKTIFNTVLKECLLPKAALLIRTFHTEEYTALFETLSTLPVQLPEMRRPAPFASIASYPS